MSSIRINMIPDNPIHTVAPMPEEDADLLGVDGLEDIELITEQQHCDPVIIPAYSIPIVNAGVGSIKVALGLIEKHSNYPFIISVSGVNFLVMLGMNLRYTMDGIRKTVSYLRTRTVPTDWAAISDGRHGVALTMALATSITKASTDAVLNRYFVTRVPIKFKFADAINMQAWEVFGWSLSGFTFIGTLASGGMTMYLKLRNIVCGGTRTAYSNRVSHYVSPIVGTTLSLTYAVSNVSGTIVSVTSTFGISSPPAIAGVCALSLVNAVNSQFTNIPFNVNALDKFFGSFTADNGHTPAYKDPYTVVSFTIAMAAGGLIGYSSRALTNVLINHSLEILGANYTTVTDPIVETISNTAILSNVLWVGGALTPLFYEAATGAVRAISKCCQQPELAENMEEVQPLLVDDIEARADTATIVSVDAQPKTPAIPQPEGASHRFFAPAAENRAAEHHEPQQSSHCIIL